MGWRRVRVNGVCTIGKLTDTIIDASVSRAFIVLS
jgi:hypothetical protein